MKQTETKTVRKENIFVDNSKIKQGIRINMNNHGKTGDIHLSQVLHAN